jgi:hypothetical protein
MITAQEFVKAAEDFAVTRLFFEALVREGNVLAEDVATYEPNTPAHRTAQDHYERIQSAAASAQTALGRYELALLRHVQDEYVDLIEAALDRLRIAGGTEAAKAIADQLESRYIDESRIPEEAR